MKEKKERQVGFRAKYDPELDKKGSHTYAVDRRLGNKDVNPLLKINYDGKNYKDTKGPINFNLPKLKRSEKRARFLFCLLDQYDKIPQWTFGPAYLAAVLEENDYEVEIFNGTVFHLSTKDLERFLEERGSFDYIGFGYLTNYIHDVIRYIDVCRACTPNSKIILGGNGYTPLPAFYLAKTGADYGVSGEAETSLLNLVNALSSNESIENIPSISFRDGENIHVSTLREPVPDITKIPLPAYDLFPISSYAWYESRGYHRGVKSFNFLTSRGCPYRCNFCYRLEMGHRHRPFDHVLEEFNLLNDKYGISHFFMSDELFMTSRRHVIDFSNQLAHAMDTGILPRITWETTGRFNIVDDESAKAMAAAGCNRVLYGLESGDTKVLELMNKKTSYEMIENGIDITMKAGMDVNLPCMFGNIGETADSIKKTVELLKKYSGTAERLVRPVTPYPGSPLYKYALYKGLLKNHEHFWEISKNPDLLTINFTEMDDATFYRVLYEANAELIDAYHNRMKTIKKKSFENLYFKDDDTAFTIVDNRERG
jgi:radical SAM superfamily enzyme YgiQ (UPF0313 family)